MRMRRPGCCVSVKTRQSTGTVRRAKIASAGLWAKVGCARIVVHCGVERVISTASDRVSADSPGGYSHGELRMVPHIHDRLLQWDEWSFVNLDSGSANFASQFRYKEWLPSATAIGGSVPQMDERCSKQTCALPTCARRILSVAQ